jgi:hypothetical protein
MAKKGVMKKVFLRDPTVREDGLCFVCEGERPPLAIRHGDPFCSARCCQTHYQVLKEGDGD